MARCGLGYLRIHSAKIRNFRCFKEFSIENSKRFNVIVGDNGSGKTALLEAFSLALASSPAIALRYRALRGLELAFSGPLYLVEEAIWRGLFYQRQWENPLSITLYGEGRENRSVTVSRGAQTEVPYGKAAEASGSVGIKFSWKNAANQYRTYIAKVSQTGITFGDTEEEHLPDYFYFPANQTVPAYENAIRFSELSRDGRIPEILEAIRQQYEHIENLTIEIDGGLPTIYATLKGGERLPLAYISSGINRVISIMLSIAARENPVVLIDEIEDGIYFKRQRKIWEELTAFTRRRNGQLFLTTHSQEWVETVFESHNVDDIALWRLEMTDQGPQLRQFSGKQISVAVRSLGEVR